MHRCHPLLLWVWLTGCDLEHLDARTDEKTTECAGRGPAFCASRASELDLCADFAGDPPPSLEDDFGVNTSGSGQVAIEPGVGCAGSNAVRMTILGGTDCSYAKLDWTSTAAFESATISADLLFGEPDAGTRFTAHALSIETQTTPDTLCRHFVVVGEGALKLHSQRYQVFDDFLDASVEAPLGVWTRIELRLDVVGDKPQVSVVVDGQTVIEPTLRDKCGAGSGASFHVGLHCQTVSESMRADNLTIDLK